VKELKPKKDFNYRYGFITCNPGSGSGMLCTLLNQHPDVMCVYEFGLFGIRPKNGTRTKLSYIEYFNKCFPWFKDNHKIMKEIQIRYLQGASLDEVIDYLLAVHPNKPSFFIDKFPNSCLNISSIVETPSLGVILLHRNAFASINGTFQKAKKSRGRLKPGVNYGPCIVGAEKLSLLEASCLQYIRSVEAMESVFCKSNVYRVDYEDLVCNTDKIMFALLDFLGLDNSKRKSYVGINLERLDAWKKELTEAEKKKIKSICFEYGLEF